MSGKRVCGPLQLLCEKFVEAAACSAMLGKHRFNNLGDCKESGHWDSFGGVRRKRYFN